MKNFTTKPDTNKMQREFTEVPSYVSLGSIISSVIGNYFINCFNNSIDEVQLVFYTANENIGRKIIPTSRP